MVLLDTFTGAIFTANAIGAAVWTYIADGRSIEDAVAAIATAYGAPHERVARDVDKFVAALVERGLLIADTRQGSAS